MASKQRHNVLTESAVPTESIRAGARPVDGRARGSLLRPAGLVALSAFLSAMSFEPFGQFYLAWVCLVPWLFALSGLRSYRSAFLVGWAGGVAFFAATIWWLGAATIPGTFALFIYFGLYWAGTAVVVWSLVGVGGAGSGSGSARVNSPLRCVLLVPMVWVGAEWLRSWAIRGFPWVMLGHSQTSLPVMCQVADMTGPFGISFWVVAVNALIFLAIRCRGALRPLVPAGGAVLAVLAGTLTYGLYRLTEDATYPGPRTMVVQTDCTYRHGGVPSFTPDEFAARHLSATREGLGREAAELVVWCEGATPPLNDEARRELARTTMGPLIEATERQISGLSRTHQTSIVVGSYSMLHWSTQQRTHAAGETRNSVYLYDSGGRQSAQRYDKVQLVPFAETMPFFEESIPWLHRSLLRLSACSDGPRMVPGDPELMTVFTIPASVAVATRIHADDGSPGVFRFVTPICLENIDSHLIARMFRRTDGTGKRADFIVNLSNDGWFSDGQRPQHLQAAMLRCVENRVPMARSANTGISAFIDSCGRVTSRLPVHTVGTSTTRLMLDKRVTLYTRWGDVFGAGCAIVVGTWWVVSLLKGRLSAIPTHRDKRY